MVRSPHPHARIVKIVTDAAKVDADRPWMANNAAELDRRLPPHHGREQRARERRALHRCIERHAREQALADLVLLFQRHARGLLLTGPGMALREFTREMAGAAVIGYVVPAFRASRVEPAVALRSE